MKLTRLLAMLLALIFAVSAFAACTEDEGNTPDDGTTAADTTAEPEDTTPAGPIDDYSANPFTPEVYDPNADNEMLDIFGAAYSDGDNGVIYGKCAVGATVTVTLPDGEFSVQSEGGRFAIRVHSATSKLEAVITQSYNGEQIGEPLNWTGKLKVPEHGEANFDAIIGYSNQGFFKKMLPDFTHTNLLDEETASDITKRIATRVNQLKAVANGCELIYLIAPSVITTYPEIVPPEVATQGEGKSKLDQAIEILEGAGAKVIDVRDSFAAHKNDELPLYYNYDSHWSEYGAYLAYVELFNYISEKYPAAAPRKFDEFNWTWNYYTRGDMPYYFGVCTGGTVYEHAVLREMNFETSPIISEIKRYTKKNSLAFNSYSDEMMDGGTYETGREDLPNLYVYRSSYGMQMYDLIPERGNNTTMHTCFYYTFNLSKIVKTNPNYVIFVISEWDIDELFTN